MSSAGLDLQKPFQPDSFVLETQRLCDRIAEVKPENTQALFGDIHQMAMLYYENALSQASRSFIAAQVFAWVGSGFVLAAAVALWITAGT